MESLTATLACGPPPNVAISPPTRAGQDEVAQGACANNTINDTTPVMEFRAMNVKLCLLLSSFAGG